jgi:putative FmdB family regulatory protein
VGISRIREEEGRVMPMYDFRCTACKKSFSVVMDYEEYGAKKVACPACKKRTTVTRVFSPIFAKTSKKS